MPALAFLIAPRVGRFEWQAWADILEYQIPDAILRFLAADHYHSQYKNVAPTGVITVEFPGLETQMAGNQFDTIYQEHYCYFSFTTVEKVFAAHGITLFDVEDLTTHGGSLRIYGRHDNEASKPVTDNVLRVRSREEAAGLTNLSAYRAFADQAEETKRRLLSFLIEAKQAGKTIVGYGAPGKATTLLNYCGVRSDFLDYLVDRSPYKHGRYMPGVRLRERLRITCKVSFCTIVSIHAPVRERPKTTTSGDAAIRCWRGGAVRGCAAKWTLLSSRSSSLGCCY